MNPLTRDNKLGCSEALDSVLDRALFLDLEVSHNGNILKVGAAVRGQTLARSGAVSVRAIAKDLTQLASMADCVLGHNLVRHDLPILQEQAPDLPLFRLPVIDTLVLSPVCFPENPYHRLVKDYKLVRESLNDPVADARQAAILFADEFRSLAGLLQTDKRVFDLLHFLLAKDDGEGNRLAKGMALVFRALGVIPPTQQEALLLSRELVSRWACSSATMEERLFHTQSSRLALAYALTWLRVAGGNSVLPPWVRHQYPETGELLTRLREVPCNASTCTYCRQFHNSTGLLREFFRYDAFRAKPAGRTGGSLQQEIVEAGMRNESLLAILPTGGGKSLCYQVPALARNRRRGVLTIILSPLQALMKDQVDGLVRRTETSSAAALFGLLTQPERSDVLRRIRMGDIALLYVSPEQLRNRSFEAAIKEREIGCWVFDEAHCVSKWGHDFRPDYLYAGRFIREFSRRQGCEIPAIACFTATAKKDVVDEITAFFKAETGRDLTLYEGGVERENLHYDVQSIAGSSKLEVIHSLLTERLPEGAGGTAIVFRATRDETELTSTYLLAHGWKSAHFHAGLTPPQKKRIQDEFLAGETKVICATNAFGMGIDKDDVRLVIHADTPGSLENYVQEAGRAGRDGLRAECILLYSEADCERQFRMEALSELSRRDIAQILRGLRRAARGEKQELVITSGEILRDEDLQLEIDVRDRMADTKVRTAISWLERANFLHRDENVTNVFQARPLVKNIPEAEAKISTLNLSEAERALWLAILREIFNTEATESLTVDRLALLPELSNYVRGNPAASPEYLSKKILQILRSMTECGLMKRDMRMTAYVRHKVADHSRLRLDRIMQVDRKLVDLMSLEDPDPEGWLPLSLCLLNQRLRDEACETSVDLVRSLLKSLSEDGRGFGGTHGSIDIRYVARDSYHIRVRRNWTLIVELAEKRRRLSSVVLDTLLEKIPDESPARADVLVEFSFEELHTAIEKDLLLRAEVRDIDAAIERALMFLHEQKVVTLQQGLAVFRSAMTIRFKPEARGERYKTSDFQPLEHHYKERILQVHVMSEYARLGLQRVQSAVDLVLNYFALPKDEFLRRYFRSRPDLLEHATTADSFQKIVTDLANPSQIRVVAAPLNRNMLILAGPGSGKTRVVVHRCAYLLRVERVRPQSILVCCFNRNAAIQLRRRLTDLVGDDARGVTVLTYHGLAMRLLGFSFAAQATKARDIDFDALIADATKLLRGETKTVGIEADEVRDRLLAGFQFILVDEYQDIDQPQYELISAIAGRTIEDPDMKLSILAVGDDDQNIYTFRGANVQFIREFQKDYDAEVHYLVENYRSTRYIIHASNNVISVNRDRMKTERPIQIDRRRVMLPAGGEFEQRDELCRGKVQIIEVNDSASQAKAVLAELQRLRELGVTDWSRIAVLSREHTDLAQVRSIAEKSGIPIRWFAARGRMPTLHHIREVHRLLATFGEQRTAFRRASDLRGTTVALFSGLGTNPWVSFALGLMDAWEKESNNAETPVQEALEFLYEACAESRRDFSYGDGVTLCTVHAAKGTEYDHVLLIGPWKVSSKKALAEEERRTFYVGLTRARKTLAVLDRKDARPSFPETMNEISTVRYPFTHNESSPSPEYVSYRTLSLEDFHLGYAGQFGTGHPVHAALAQLTPLSGLTMEPTEDNGVGLFNDSHTCVALLSRAARAEWSAKLDRVLEVRVLGMARRTAGQDPDEERRKWYRTNEWEVPVAEVVVRDA